MNTVFHRLGMRIAALICLVLILAGPASAFDYNVSTGSFSGAYSSSFSDFHWYWSDYADQYVHAAFTAAVPHVVFRMSYPSDGDAYLTFYNPDIQTSATMTVASFIVSRTNVPPKRTYYAEFLGAETNMVGTNLVYSPTRILARGQITVQHSVFSGTNEATFTPIDVYYDFSGTWSNSMWTDISKASDTGSAAYAMAVLAYSTANAATTSVGVLETGTPTRVEWSGTNAGFQAQIDNITVGSVVYGVATGTAYRGDWGHAVSNRTDLAYTAGTTAQASAQAANTNADARVSKTGDTMTGALTFSGTNGITISKAYTPIELGTQWDGFYTNAPWRIHTSNFKGPWNDLHILYNARNYPDASGTIENWTNRDVNGLSSICMDITPNYSNAAGEWVLWQFRTAVKDTGAPVWVDSFGVYISTTNQTNAIAYWRGAMAFGAANPGGVAGYQATFYTDAVRTSAAYFAGTVRLQDTYSSTEAGSVYNKRNRDSTAKDSADWYTLQGTNRWLVGMGPTIAGESRYGWTRWNGSAWVNAGHFDDAGKLILSNGLQAAGIATGTPVYVESDPIWAATQGYYRVWGAGVTQTATGAVITASGSMDYDAVQGASNDAAAAHAYAGLAWSNGVGLGVVVSNIVTYAPTNAAPPLTINVANSTTATVTRAPGMHHVRINLTNASTFAGPQAGGWADAEAGYVLVWYYGTGSLTGAGISLTNMAGKLMATNCVGAVWSKPPAGAWENLPLK